MISAHHNEYLTCWPAECALAVTITNLKLQADTRGLTLGCLSVSNLLVRLEELELLNANNWQLLTGSTAGG